MQSAPLRLRRRHFLLSASATLAAPAITRAAGPIRIGAALAMTDRTAVQGEYLWQGTKLALELAGGKALGQPVELLRVDEPSGPVAYDNLSKLVKESGIVAATGGTLTRQATGLQKAATEGNIPLVLSGSPGSILTGKQCGRWSFRVPPSLDVQMTAMQSYLIGYGKKWAFLTAVTPTGVELRDLGRRVAKEAGATEVMLIETQPNQADYREAIAKLRSTPLDVIVGGLVASDMTKFLREWHAADMTGRVPFTQAGVDDCDVWDVGPQAATGVFAKPWDYMDKANTAEDKAFTQAYFAHFQRAPSAKSWIGYISMRILLAAIEKAGAPEPERIRAALEQVSLRHGDLDLAFRGWDHQMLMRVLVPEVKTKITDKWNYFDVETRVPQKTEELEKLYGTRDQIGCAMT